MSNKVDLVKLSGFLHWQAGLNLLRETITLLGGEDITEESMAMIRRLLVGQDSLDDWEKLQQILPDGYEIAVNSLCSHSAGIEHFAILFYQEDNDEQRIELANDACEGQPSISLDCRLSLSTELLDKLPKPTLVALTTDLHHWQSTDMQ